MLLACSSSKHLQRHTTHTEAIGGELVLERITSQIIVKDRRTFSPICRVLAARVRANSFKVLRNTLPFLFFLKSAHSFSMASEAGEADQDESVDEEASTPARNGQAETENVEEGEASEEDEDEEPRLKYASLTKHLKPVYRNGDATSAFLVAGDKMVGGSL